MILRRSKVSMVLPQHPSVALVQTNPQSSEMHASDSKVSYKRISFSKKHGNSLTCQIYTLLSNMPIPCNSEHTVSLSETKGIPYKTVLHIFREGTLEQ